MGLGTGGGNPTHFQNSVVVGSDANNPAVVVEQVVVTANTATGNTTYTAREVAGGLVIRTPTGAAADTLPTATLLRDYLVNQGKGGKLVVGSKLRLHIRNSSGGANTITVTAGTGVTISGTATIAQNNGKDFLIVFTAVGAVPTYTAYSLGTTVF